MEIGKNPVSRLKEEFTSKQIERNLGLKANTLHYYIKAGGIIPDIDPGSGTGTSRKFSAINYFEAAIILNLMRYGLPKRTILEILINIKTAGDRSLLDPGEIYKLENCNRYLICWTQGEHGYYAHRFLNDGGDAFKKNREDWPKYMEQTSFDELESLTEFLTFIPYSIIINLNHACALFMSHLIVEDV